MNHFIVHLLHIGAWLFGLIFLFAVIGFFAVIAWIVNAFRRTEAAVGGGVRNVEARFDRRESSEPNDRFDPPSTLTPP